MMSPEPGDFTESLQEDFAPGWRPEEGSVIIGRLRKVSRGYSDQSESYYPILTIHDESTDEDVSVHAFHQALQGRLAALKPDIGERIGIKMGPKIPLKSNPNRSVQTYTVKIDGRDEKINWDDYGQRDTPAAKEQPTETQSDDDIPF